MYIKFKYSIEDNLYKNIYRIYIYEMNKILDVVEDIKQNITDNQYKIIMDSLMEINKIPALYTNHKNNKFICLLQWLDTKLEITDSADDKIKRNELYKFIRINFYYYNYYANIDFVKQILKIFLMHATKEQDHNQVFKYVKYII